MKRAGRRADRLYALAVLVEAYRESGALDELLARLNAGADTAPALVETRVDLLIETEHYDEAIRYYRTTDDAGVDVAARQRLLNLYEAAGRTADMVAEYRRLMASEPRVVHWFAGLAGHYMNMAEPPQALAVWQALEAANADHPPTLLEAAERMLQMGFTEEAVAMVERQMAADGEHADGLLFLFDVRRGQGRDEAALASLQRLEALLPPDDSAIRELADAYERLNKPQAAIRLLEQLRTNKGELGYDERMRLAWLYSVAERKPEALATWRALWVSVDSAARRSLAENQMLLLAAELNALADIVVELEEKLANGDADKNEMNLLARIYTEVGDSLSATEVIAEFARRGGGDDINRLRQLGRVHMLLKDYSAYDKVLRQLVAADPQNEAEHVQNLVLNMLAYDLAEDSDERFTDIQRWLAKLRTFDAEGVSGEFEAGVLSLGGFNDEAIESYRRTLVLQPENSDNLLLMADMMKRTNRRDEAVSLLQYAAEHAVDDNAFVVAVDGIVNMIGARSFSDRLTPAMRRTFRWAERIILERITGRADKFYLYQLLADIAQETGDHEGEFLALENSLSQAGLRRPAILRELVTLATPNTGYGGFDTGGGDRERQLKHGRRLIGLRQALPPEVYIDLGKVLLERGDLAGAEKAFDGIDDITGLIDVNKTKADLLHEAGHSAEALNYYTRALSVKPDDLALLAKTALLRETNGQLAVANRLYERALGNVLRTQPATAKAKRPGSDQSPMAMFGPRVDLAVTRDYRTYFETLAQGSSSHGPKTGPVPRSGSPRCAPWSTTPSSPPASRMANSRCRRFPGSTTPPGSRAGWRNSQATPNSGAMWTPRSRLTRPKRKTLPPPHPRAASRCWNGTSRAPRARGISVPRRGLRDCSATTSESPNCCANASPPASTRKASRLPGPCCRPRPSAASFRLSWPRSRTTRARSLSSSPAPAPGWCSMWRSAWAAI